MYEITQINAGSIGLKVGEDSLVVGDALMHMFRPEKTLLYEEYEEMQESARKIGNMGKRKIYFGHGKMVWNRKWVKEHA